MDNKHKRVLIIGSGDNSGLLPMRIAELKAQNPDVEVVTIEEAKERGLHETFEFKARPKIPVEPIIITTNHYVSEPGYMSKRAARRKAERDAKKKKKRW